MLAVALTGGIATGKTTVLNFFSEAGVPVIDSDAIVALLYKKPAVKEFLQKNFSSLDKKEIAAQVFSDSKKRALLESFLHPLVFSAIDSRIRRLEKKRKTLAVIEIPLLFEAGREKNFSKVIVVKATQPQQVHRLQKQGLSAAEAFARIKSQKPLEHKARHADFVIDNTGSLDFTKARARRILKALKKN